MKVAHVVMTRFAVRWPGLSSRLSPKPLSPAWLAERFGYFARYCVPSLQAQTVSAFRWLVYVHDGLDAGVASRLLALDSRIELRTDDDRQIPRMGADILISTRVDSDDALAADVLEMAQSAARANDAPLLLRFSRGHVLRERDGRCYIGPASAFASLIERDDSAVGVRAYNSEDILTRVPFTPIMRPSWIRVVHGGNIRNKFKPQGKTVPLASLAGPLFPWLEAA